MNRAGIYIHVPFCRSRCSYCDFATGAFEAALAETYVGALAREGESVDFEGARNEGDTVYFGAGTPSVLTPAQVSRVLDSVRRKFDVDADAEVTLEMNP